MRDTIHWELTVMTGDENFTLSFRFSLPLFTAIRIFFKNHIFDRDMIYNSYNTSISFFLILVFVLIISAKGFFSWAVQKMHDTISIAPIARAIE